MVILVKVAGLEINLPVIVALEICASVDLSILVMMGSGIAYRGYTVWLNADR